MGSANNQRSTKKIVCFSIFIVLGLTMVAVGSSILVHVFPKIMDKKIAEGLRIENDNSSETFERFVESPVPSYMSFHLFTIENKDDVNKKGSIPVLKEMGPYVYRQEKIKENVKFDKEKGTIFYNERTMYFYEKEKSKGSLDDKVNHVNALSVAILEDDMLQYLFQSMGGSIEKPMSDTNKAYIDTHTVDELLFEGFATQSYFPDYLGLDLCVMAKQCLFGYYYGKNNTVSEEFQVSSGADDIKTIGQIVTYKGQSELSYWEKNTHCNAINGTDGKQFPPGLDKDKSYDVFSTDICRSLKFDYVEDVVVEKIDAYRYAVPEEVFADPNKDSNNMCYCHKGKVNDTCPSKAGVIPLMTCQEGKPIAVSSPHFLYGEKEYVDNFKGLNPQKQKHQTTLDIEPMTGTVIQGAKRLQINMLVQPRENVNFLEHVKKPLYFPMFWVEEGGKIDSKTAEEFRDKVTTPYKTAKWSLVAVIAVGAVMFLLVVVLALFKGCR